SSSEPIEEDYLCLKWEASIAAFRASGEKATKWCNANQVNRRQLYSWMCVLDRENKVLDWVG
ncbi:IS66 family insertion sequence element accessory protein TnpA, partial [Paenibacillus oleatilyticus]